MQNRSYISLLVWIASVFGCHLTYAQNSRSVEVLARVTSQSIKLRWAPSDPTVWQLANTYGYTVERVTLTKGQQISRDKELQTLEFRPAQLPDWEQYMEDDYVAVAAQAIYGESFDVSQDTGSPMIQSLNKAKEIQNRYSFAIFAADQSIEAAQMSGLFHEDHQVQVGYRYLYKVYANIPQERLSVDTAYVFVGLDDYQPLIQPQDVMSETNDQNVIISWSAESFLSGYTAFWVEKSSGGSAFKRVTDNPIVNAQKGNQPLERLYFSDTISFDKSYKYRIIGVNAFGELSPPSDTLEVKAEKPFRQVAMISGHEVTPEGTVKINWQIQGLITPTMTFDLLRTDSKASYLDPAQSNIAFDLRSAIDHNPNGSSYYVVRANDNRGNSTLSFPYLVNMEDSIPPAQPVGLTGRIDTSGLVHLNWMDNSESDLEGYKVFRKNFESEEWIAISGPILKSSSYVDTISVTTLTENIFYAVRAFDTHVNASDLLTIRLKKPDLVPPVTPLIVQIYSDSLGIAIKWEASPSEDVENYLLYRKSVAEDKWTLIHMDDGKLAFYLDKQVSNATKYAYTLIAVDDDGLESQPAQPSIITFNKSEIPPPITDIFSSTSDRTIEIQWEYNLPNVARYIVYKKVNETFQEWKVTEESYFSDALPGVGKSIEYKLLAEFISGRYSAMSKSITIQL